MSDAGNQGQGNDSTGATDGAGAIAPIETVSFADLKSAGLADNFFTDKGFDAKSVVTQLTELGTLRTHAEERAKNIPADGAYKFDLPEDFKQPEGQKWVPNEALTKGIATVAKELNLTQSEVSKLTTAYAAHQVEQIKAATEAQKTETAANEADAKAVLGSNYSEVCANLRQAMVPIFGQELATNIGFQKAADVKAMLDFVENYKTKLAANPNIGGEQPPDPLSKLYPSMNATR